jgi:hypothetical protein
MGTSARTYTGPARHLASLVSLRGAWQEWDGYFPPDLALTALAALSGAPGERRPLGAITEFIAGHQAEDGTWPQADRFVALEALLGAETPAAIAAIGRAAPALAAGVRADGTFGPVAQQERALIGLRALLTARA